MTARRGSLAKPGIAAGDDISFTGAVDFDGRPLGKLIPIIGADNTVVGFNFVHGTETQYRIATTFSGGLCIEVFKNGISQGQAIGFASETGALVFSQNLTAQPGVRLLFKDPPGEVPWENLDTISGRVFQPVWPDPAGFTANRQLTFVMPDANTIFTLSSDFVTPTVARTTAVQSFNLTTALADVTGLTAALKASKVYKVRAVLFASVGGGGLQAALNDATGAADIQYVTAVIQTTGMSNVQRRTAYDVGTGSSSASVIMIVIEGYIKNNATPGTLAVRAAQDMSNGTDSDILEGSTLEVQEIV